MMYTVERCSPVRSAMSGTVQGREVVYEIERVFDLMRDPSSQLTEGGWRSGQRHESVPRASCRPEQLIFLTGLDDYVAQLDSSKAWND